MAPQGGVAAAHDQPVIDTRATRASIQLGHDRLQGPGNLLNPGSGCLGGQGAGVSQYKEQGRRVRQTLEQGGPIPLQQQGTAVHRLGSGGVVIEDDDLEATGHGTIVP